MDRIEVITCPSDWQETKHFTEFENAPWIASIVRDIPIYQHLITYAFHRSRRSYNRTLIDEFLATVESWKTLDFINALLRYRLMVEQIQQFIRKTLDNGLLSHLDASHTLEDDRMKKLLDMDIIAMCTRLSGVLTDRGAYRDLISRRGDEAQTLLNLFQTLLDLPTLPPRIKGPLVNLLINLSGRSGLYPECLVLRGVEHIGRNPVAAGKFGEVWKGKIQGHTVSIKILKLYVKSDIIKHLKQCSREAIIWRQLKNDHVLPFYGIYHLNEDRARVCLVSPWMDNGNVTQFIRMAPDTDRTRLVLDVALGLKYLHAMKVIHGDLKGVNILVTSSHRACLADFGLSTASDSQMLKLSTLSSAVNGGTLRWEAPELLDGSQECTTFWTDIYAFACVCYEIYSGHIPFFTIPNDFSVGLKVLQGLRPSRDSCHGASLDDETWTLIERCWTAIPRERPSANDVVKQLRMRPGLDTDRRAHRDDKWDLSFGHRLRSTLLDNNHPFLDDGLRDERSTVSSHDSEEPEDSTSVSPFTFNVADETETVKPRLAQPRRVNVNGSKHNGNVFQRRPKTQEQVSTGRFSSLLRPRSASL